MIVAPDLINLHWAARPRADDHLKGLHLSPQLSTWTFREH
jgi:hypothetical protein